MTTAFSWGPTSLKHRNSVDQELAQVLDLMLVLSPIDISLTDGYRTRKRQAELVESGASKTLESAHCDRLAVDFIPAGGDPYPRKSDSPEVVKAKLRKFEVIAAAFFEACDQLDFPGQWGNDWDCDGIPTGRDPDEKGYLQDMVHLQKAPPHRVAQARKRAQERRALRASGERVVS